MGDFGVRECAARRLVTRASSPVLAVFCKEELGIVRNIKLNGSKHGLEARITGQPACSVCTRATGVRPYMIGLPV